MVKKVLVFVLLLLVFVGGKTLLGGEMMKLSSSAFGGGGHIPLKYVMPGAGGENLSPPLQWEDVPADAKSFAVSCYDPHPVAKNWVHWLVVNIPEEVHALPEGASRKAIPSGAVELVNSFGFRGYGGPQPPPSTGEHPYVFTVYALKVEKVNLSGRLSIEEFEESLKPYMLDKASITGYFGR
jgi:Raf kinase inhibitor-like YbhB/YbcL family protein